MIGRKNAKIERFAHCVEYQRFVCRGARKAVRCVVKTSGFCIKNKAFPHQKQACLRLKTNGFAMQTRLLFVTDTDIYESEGTLPCKKLQEHSAKNSRIRVVHVKIFYRKRVLFNISHRSCNCSANAQVQKFVKFKQRFPQSSSATNVTL